MLAERVTLTPAERDDVDRLLAAGPPSERAGLATGATADEVRVAAVAGIERWRGRLGNPLSDRSTIEAAEIVVRAYEHIHATA